MQVTAYQLKTNAGSLIKRAAKGEEILITERGIAKARLVPVEHFDAARQRKALAGIARIRAELVAKGKRFTRKEIRDAIEEGRL